MPMHASTAPLLGILMLNTRFPRPPGDIGNPETWPFPVRYEVVVYDIVSLITWLYGGHRPRSWTSPPETREEG